MTEQTTPITVHLTEKQMDSSVTFKELGQVLWAAIEEQRPRPIKIGDLVDIVGEPKMPTLEVWHIGNAATGEDWAWLWLNGQPFGHVPITALTHQEER